MTVAGEVVATVAEDWGAATAGATVVEARVAGPAEARAVGWAPNREAMVEALAAARVVEMGTPRRRYPRSSSHAGYLSSNQPQSGACTRPCTQRS